MSPKFVLSLLCLCLAARAGSAVKLSQYQFRYWATEHGLPGAVNALCQTRDGYLWVATSSGLARFDGVRFTVFDVLKNPEMVNDTCRSLAEGTDGSLWIATNDGLLQWKDNRFRRFSTANGLPRDETRGVWPSRCGGVWVSLTKSYTRYHHGTFTNYAHLHLPFDSRGAAYEDDFGNVWISGVQTLWRMDGRTGRWLQLAGKDEPAGERLLGFHHGRSGSVWFGNNAGLFRWGGDRLEHFDPAASITDTFLQPELVQCIIELRNGDVWVAATGNNVLYRFKEGSFMQLRDEHGRPIQQVTSLLEDREGNIWIGTRFSGLLKLHPRQVMVYSTDDGLGNDAINSVAQARDGTIWVGASRSHFAAIRNGQVTPYTLTDEGFRRSEFVILPTGTDIWLGVSGANDDHTTLWTLEGGRPVRTEIKVHGKYIWALYEDDNGDLWIGTEEGARRLRRGDRTVTLVEGIPGKKVNAFLRDSAGAVWIATDRGLARWTEQGCTVFTATNGLAHDFVSCVYEDAHKRLWVGTRRGLSLYQDGSFILLSREHGMPDETVCTVLEDNHGCFWIGSNRGIHRVKMDDLYAAAHGMAGRIDTVSFGLSEGMLSSDTRSKGQPAAWKASDGTLWFATIKGVAVINPGTITDNTNPPPVVVEQVLSGNRVVYGLGAPGHLGHALELKPGDGRFVEFRYTATSFVAPEKVAFKYRLKGHDRDWIEGGSRRAAYYTNLKPGYYKFEVKACNNSGTWNEAPAELGFYAAPHFYQTFPFYLACGAATVLTGAALHRRRLRVWTHIKQLEHTHALEEERARIAQDMHDDLGANLTQVAILSEVAKKALHTPEKAADYVDRISTAARSMVDSITEIIWTIGPRNDRLDSLCAFLREQTSQRCEDGGVECELSFPTAVDSRPVSAVFRRNLLLVLKESLNNMLKHSGAERASVSIRFYRHADADWLELAVVDKGRGFDKTGISQFKNGLRNMRERIESLGGQLMIQSKVGSGTRIQARVPLATPRQTEEGPSGARGPHMED